MAGRAFDEKYRPMVARWCRGLGLSPERADELANDVMFEVLRRLPTFAYDPSKGFRRWLRTIVGRRVTDVLRRGEEELLLLGDAERWIASPEEDDEADDGHDVFKALRERGARVHRRVQARVKPSSWALFSKVHIEGMLISEAARELGLEYSNALKRYKGVLQILREEGKRPDDDQPAGTEESDESRS